MPPVHLDRKSMWGVTDVPPDPPHHRVFATATKTLLPVCAASGLLVVRCATDWSPHALPCRLACAQLALS